MVLGVAEEHAGEPGCTRLGTRSTARRADRGAEVDALGVEFFVVTDALHDGIVQLVVDFSGAVQLGCKVGLVLLVIATNSCLQVLIHGLELA